MRWRSSRKRQPLRAAPIVGASRCWSLGSAPPRPPCLAPSAKPGKSRTSPSRTVRPATSATASTGVRRAGLSHAKVAKPAYPLYPQRGWRGASPLRSPGGPPLRLWRAVLAHPASRFRSLPTDLGQAALLAARRASAIRFAITSPPAAAASGAGSWGFKGGAASPWPDRKR